MHQHQPIAPGIAFGVPVEDIATADKSTRECDILPLACRGQFRLGGKGSLGRQGRKDETRWSLGLGASVSKRSKISTAVVRGEEVEETFVVLV